MGLYLTGLIITTAFALYGFFCVTMTGDAGEFVVATYAGFVFATALLVIIHLKSATTITVLTLFPLEEKRKGLLRFFWVFALVSLSSVFYAPKHVSGDLDFAGYIVFLATAIWIVRDVVIYTIEKRR